MAIYNVVINNDIASGGGRWHEVERAVRVNRDRAQRWVSQRGCGDGERICGVWINVVGQYHNVIERHPNIGAGDIGVGGRRVVSASNTDGERAAARRACAVYDRVIKYFLRAGNALIQGLGGGLGVV